MNTKQIYKSTWIDSSQTTQAVWEIIGQDSCLNVCCGLSKIGDIRYDVNENTTRTEYGDLFDLKHLPSNIVDWVYCDPPFDYYVKGDNRFSWQHELFRICRKGLITQRPKVKSPVKAVFRTYRVIENKIGLALLCIDYKQWTNDTK